MNKIVYIILLISVLSGSFYLKNVMKIGCIDGNCSNGVGTYYFFNGDTYSGNWKFEVFDGKGTYFWAETGNKYVGEWKNGKRYGDGILYYQKTGFIQEGNWREDKFILIE
jgi:hypothetical protein